MASHPAAREHRARARAPARLSLEEALPREVLVRRAVQHVALSVLVLLVSVGLEGLDVHLRLELLPERERILDARDAVEVLSCWGRGAVLVIVRRLVLLVVV